MELSLKKKNLFSHWGGVREWEKASSLLAALSGSCSFWVLGNLEEKEGGRPSQVEVPCAVTGRRARGEGPHALPLTAGRVLEPWAEAAPLSFLLLEIADGRRPHGD